MKKAIGIVCGFFILILYISSGACKKNSVNECADKVSIASVTKTTAIIGKSDGTITVSAAGGTGIKYSINDTSFQDSGVFTNLPGKDYTVTAKNASGCTDRLKVTIDSIPDPCLSVTVAITTTKTDANTGQANGSITASASAAGSTDFTYQINGGAFQPSGTFTGLAAATYTITAKNSIGCTGSVLVTIGTINPCAGVTVVVSLAITNPTNGASNGTITASASGGSGNGYTFSLNGGTYQGSGSVSSFTNLAPGNYTVTAKSTAGCVGSSSTTLVNTISCVGVTIVVSGTKTNPTTATQSNGTITASASGGTGFTYSLNGTTYQATGSFANLAVGSYTVYAKSSNGCVGSAVFALVDNCTTYTITITPTITGVIPCSTPANNGSISVSAAGGTGNYTYSFNLGAFSSVTAFSNLSAIGYQISAKDGAGCSSAPLVVNVGTQAAGAKFAVVKTIITTNCVSAGCHRAGTGLTDFTVDCNIVSDWSNISTRVNSTTTNRMPPPPTATLSTTDKNNIAAWITAGHLYNQ